MINNGHINTTEDIKNAFGFTDVNLDDPQTMIDYYKAHHDAIDLVSCERCGKPLCLWVSDPQAFAKNVIMHPNAMTRITIGSALKSSRLRLDKNVGYSCECGNNSIISAAEVGIVPQLHYDKDGNILNPEQSLDMHPHHEAAYQKRVTDSGWKPEITYGEDTASLEGFKTEKIK